MEKIPSHPENIPDGLTPRNRKFGDRVIRAVKDGVDEKRLNPGLGGLFYRNRAVYPYIQARLAEEQIETHVARGSMESGSDARILTETLVVDSRPQQQGS